MLGDQGRQDANNSFSRGREGNVEGQALAGKLVHDGQNPQGGAIGQGVLDKIIGPNVAGVGRLEALQAGPTPCLAAGEPSHLEPMEPPQSPDTLLINRAAAAYERANPTIAIAWVARGQLLNLRHERRVIVRLGDIAKGGAMELHQTTGALHC